MDIFDYSYLIVNGEIQAVYEVTETQVSDKRIASVRSVRIADEDVPPWVADMAEIERRKVEQRGAPPAHPKPTAAEERAKARDFHERVWTRADVTEGGLERLRQAQQGRDESEGDE